MGTDPADLQRNCRKLWSADYSLTDIATEDTKGEIMGITAAINALAFGSISFLGNAIEGVSAGAPIIAALVLMTLSWLVFGLQKPKATTKQIGQSP
jgi:hypothetical protein